MKPKVLILYGYGINCDEETKRGFELAGAEAEKVHVNELIKGDKSLKDYRILAFPGGFSFGDDLGAGKALAAKIEYNLEEELSRFIKEGNLVMGICNGFQALVKLGILPGTLLLNNSGRFEDRWVYLKPNPESPCIFTKGIEKLYLPVRHGEGKFFSGNEETKNDLVRQNRVVVRYTDPKGGLAGYPFNPNGSELNIAGVCDETGRVFGLMPHPEGFLYPHNHPRWTREDVPEGGGLKIFKNAVDFVKT